MDFARAQLEKYGWKDGDGLGKKKSGIVTALKPKLKKDKFGLGHDSSAEFTFNWWEHSFNAASNRICVTQNGDGVKVKTKKNTKPTNISTKRPDTTVDDVKKDTLTYGIFKKTACLLAEGKEERILPDSHLEESPVILCAQISDEELFRACGGRTAHKSARHGKGLSGKLARVEKQDINLTQNQESEKNERKNKRKMNNLIPSEYQNETKKKKKIKT